MVCAAQAFYRLQCTHQCHAAARYHAFFNGCAGCVQRVFNAGFLFFHFDFGCCADFDNSNAACQLGNTFLQLFAIIIRRGVFNLTTNLRNAAFDVRFAAMAINDGGVFFRYHNLLGLAKVVQGRFFQRQANFFRNHLAAGDDCDVLQHGFATVAEARCLNSTNFDDAANRVHDQRRQRFAFNVFSDDQHRTA